MEGWELAEHANQINDAMAAFIEVQGMIAANNQRKVVGESMAYDEAAFQGVMQTYELGYNENIEKKRRFF